jgi:hypothetical protein
MPRSDPNSITVISASPVSFTYDANGKMSSDGALATIMTMKTS